MKQPKPVTEDLIRIFEKRITGIVVPDKYDIVGSVWTIKSLSYAFGHPIFSEPDDDNMYAFSFLMNDRENKELWRGDFGYVRKYLFNKIVSGNKTNLKLVLKTVLKVRESYLLDEEDIGEVVLKEV